MVARSRVARVKERRIPLHTLDGVRNSVVSVHPFSTEDGLGLSMVRFHRAASDDVVLVVHGLTTSSDMFIMPEHENLVSFLLDNGFGEVWTLDYRMSNRFPYNRAMHRFTMDDVALYDYPAALEHLRAADVATPILLTTGDHNLVFADSNIECWRRLEAVAPGRHELKVFPGYGHQDVFMGKDVSRQVFPEMLDFLKRQAA